MLMIRFQRIGRKNDAAFRMAVLEKARGPKAGKYIDLVGTYNPKTKAMTVNADRIKDWIGKGAQLSPTLSNLLIKQGVIEGSKKAVVSKKNLEKNVAKNKAAEEEAAAKAAAAAAAPVAEEAPAEVEAPEEAAPAEVVEAPEEVPAEEPVKDEAAA